MLLIRQIIVALFTETIRSLSAHPAENIERRIPVFCNIPRWINLPSRRHVERILRIIAEEIIFSPVCILPAEQIISPVKPCLRIGFFKITDPRFIRDHKSGVSHSFTDADTGTLIHIT